MAATKVNPVCRMLWLKGALLSEEGQFRVEVEGASKVLDPLPSLLSLDPHLPIKLDQSA